MAEFMTLRQVAKVLGCCKSTVGKRVAEGLLPSVKFSPALTAPRYIPTEAVRTMLQVNRDLRNPIPLPGVEDQWELQYARLNRRLGKLAEVVGRDAVDAIILKHSDGGTQLLDVHPTQYGKLLGDALALSRGQSPRPKRPDMSRIMAEHWARKREEKAEQAS